MSINRELGAGTHPLVLGRSRPAGGVCGGSSDVLGCGLLIWSRSTDVEYAFLMDIYLGVDAETCDPRSDEHRRKVKLS